MLRVLGDGAEYPPSSVSLAMDIPRSPSPPDHLHTAAQLLKMYHSNDEAEKEMIPDNGDADLPLAYRDEAWHRQPPSPSPKGHARVLSRQRLSAISSDGSRGSNGLKMHHQIHGGHDLSAMTMAPPASNAWQETGAQSATHTQLGHEATKASAGSTQLDREPISSASSSSLSSLGSTLAVSEQDSSATLLHTNSALGGSHLAVPPSFPCLRLDGQTHAPQQIDTEDPDTAALDNCALSTSLFRRQELPVRPPKASLLQKTLEPSPQVSPYFALQPYAHIGTDANHGCSVTLYFPGDVSPKEMNLTVSPHATMEELIGYTLFQYTAQHGELPAPANSASMDYWTNPKHWALRMVEDGEVDSDYPRTF